MKIGFIIVIFGRNVWCLIIIFIFFLVFVIMVIFVIFEFVLVVVGIVISGRGFFVIGDFLFVKLLI